MKRNGLIPRIALLAAASLLALAFLHAQEPPGESSSKRKDKPSAAPKTNAPMQSAPDQPAWDPLRAEKDIEVGRYYMKTGNLDAAIDRFQDATLAKPGYALPFRYLGEAQEKRGLKKNAIKSYTRYLDLYPHAEDADKIRKRIEKLWAQAAKDKKSAS